MNNTVFLQRVLNRLISTPFDTPKRQRSLTIRWLAYRSRDRSYMVPDTAVAIAPRDGTVRLWPTIVVEVANSQSYEYVLAKVKRWFRKSHGMVEVALVLKFTAKKPVKSEVEGVVESASESSSDDGNGAATLHDMSSDDLRDITLPLSPIPDSGDVAPSFLRPETQVMNPLSGPRSHDAPGSDSSLSSLEDESGSDMFPTASRQDTNSSVSSLEDNPQDADLTDDQNTATSSNPSTARTSSYHFSSRRHKRHVYLSGARQTILPLADPADPATR
ncbi:hypothetical protein Q9L58_009209 [Maublancomyces gigas]|uniref:Uncharacterized protein n=1 Tax=Discina gigas TaxID=1032678 RepID=A0ABR3G7L0_9PEZI